MISGISVPAKAPKGPSALENAMDLVNSLMGLGMQIYGAKEAFSAKPPADLNTGSYQLNADYKPKIQPMFTKE